MALEDKIFHNTKCEPEIVISYFCNIDSCPYCYAREHARRTSKNMTVKEFADVVGWFKETVPSLKGITLLGGEPTIIPNLKDYLETAARANVYVNLFSNGSFDAGQAKMLCGNNAVNTVYFHFDQLHFERIPSHVDFFKRNIGELKNAGKDVRLRANFHGTGFDVELPLKIASEYSIPIAWSITSPCKSMKEYARRKDFSLVENRLARFFSEARNSGLKLQLVRPVPICAFSEEVFEEFREFAQLDRKCNVSTYVHPNRVVQFCSVMDNTRTGPVNSAEELKKAILKFQKLEIVLRGKPSFDACNSCKKFKTICQGGCLAYKVFGDRT